MRYGPTGVLGLDFATTGAPRLGGSGCRCACGLAAKKAAPMRGLAAGSCGCQQPAGYVGRGGRDLVHNTHIRTSMSYLRRPGTGGVTQSESGMRACAARSRGAVAARSRARIS